MSLDLEARLRTFYASAPQTIHPVKTLEISHSHLPSVWNLWQEPYAGQTWADGAARTMTGCNFDIKLAGSEGNLDQVFEIALGLVERDAQDTFREEMDLIPLDTKERIRIVYREYLSDDLTAAQATATLQIESISWKIGAAKITAVSPRLNILRTGELYTMRDVPMLRGFI